MSPFFSFLLVRTLTFSLHIFLTYYKPFRGFLHLWISLYCISLFFWPHDPLRRGLKLWLLWLELAHSLAFHPHGWGTSQSCVHCHNSMAFQGPCQQAAAFKVLAGKLQHSAHRPHSVRLPAWKGQSLPWQDSPESRHFKTAHLFSCYGWKPKSMRSAFHQHRLNVSWQDLLMSYKVLHLKSRSLS